MIFKSEAEFEAAVIDRLSRNGWSKKVIKYPTEKDLLDNWKKILLSNNNQRDKLNGIELTDSEMGQIIEQVTALRTPKNINGFINGDGVIIKRDNPDDKEHFGKEVSLKIYDRKEIAGGDSVYQIVQQPQFPTKNKILNDRRGDLMLLINGMPVFHIELKRSGVPVSQACGQIAKYSHEGIFSGLFSLVQVFVGMTPDETRYFANPGPDGVFNQDFYFHWANAENVPTNNWETIISRLLSIPMAHQLIGFYTVADGTDGILKVMRSYQYYAASAISKRVAEHKWEENNQRGGYIWHTTGSGKTMTSFKSAQLIAASQDADKVVFLVDRIELGTQSANAYRNFASEKEDVQETEDTGVLIKKLKSIDPSNTLIVTSIQKMSNIREDGLRESDIRQMQAKRIVFIVDECHRDTFGEMMQTIKQTFPRAVFFGFTGTPIHEENQKKMNTTVDIFGDELHKYSIADGITDGNVLGFDPDKVLTYPDDGLRTEVALDKANAKSVDEALSDPKKSAVFYTYMNLPMAGYTDENGKKHSGIEDFIKSVQYDRDEHRKWVVEDIRKHWQVLSRNGKFHAIFATSSIPEAIKYYRLLKCEAPELKVTALFDPHIDNGGHSEFKEDGLVEIIADYNDRYGQDFKCETFQKMKKDISARLAHKDAYRRIEREPEKIINILIVVDQMLTGFDSKWINTLYLDKVLVYENLIQAFSRTNRLFQKDEKPFGKIKYYRYPHTMEKNIEEAFNLYSGEKARGLFADKLPHNITCMNTIYSEIKYIFEKSGVADFGKLPDDMAVKQKFASLFRNFNRHLEAAVIQGFLWKKTQYDSITVVFDENDYNILLQRYKELATPGGDDPRLPDIPYDLDGCILKIDTATIDAAYMNSRFENFKQKRQSGDTERIKEAEDELHKTFAILSQEEQKYANIFLNDIQCGNIIPEEGKTFRDYISEYQSRSKDDQVHRCAETFGLDEKLLRRLVLSRDCEGGPYRDLVSKYNKQKTKEYFENLEGTTISIPLLYPKLNNLLRDFILSGGYELKKEMSEGDSI